MSKLWRRAMASGAVIAAGALAMPAASQAGPLEPVFEPVFHTQQGTYHYVGNSGAPEVFALAYSQLNKATNQQTVTGTFGTAVVAGTAFNHTYDRAADEGHYTLTGTFDPTGAAPPLPLFANAIARVDRVQEVTVVEFSGNIGGQPFFATTGPIVNPTY